jgi:hypothetical protein
MGIFERRLLGFLVPAILAISLNSCGGDKPTEAEKTRPSSEPSGRTETQRRGIEESKSTIVAKVNGAPVSGLDLVNEMNQVAPQYIKPGQARGPGLDKKIRQEALDRLIYRELAVQEAKRAGLKAPPEAVSEELGRIRKEWKTEESFRQFLAKSGITEEEIKIQVERNILVEMITEKEIFGKVTMDAASGQTEMDKDRMAAAVRKREDAWISGLKKRARIEITAEPGIGVSSGRK